MYDVRALDSTAIKVKYQKLSAWLDEKRRRLWAAVEAEQLGFGGVAAVAAATGLSRNTIRAGLTELASARRRRRVPRPADGERIRQPGGGRKRLTEKDPRVVAALDALVQPYTRGDPMSPLRWTCKSTARLAAELSRQGHRIGVRKVAALLHELEYSLQANRKTRDGPGHPDRNAQFEYINAQTRAFQRRRQPVISVDTKKKELVGDFKNAGREWRPKGHLSFARITSGSGGGDGGTRDGQNPARQPDHERRHVATDVTVGGGRKARNSAARGTLSSASQRGDYAARRM